MNTAVAFDRRQMAMYAHKHPPCAEVGDVRFVVLGAPNKPARQGTVKPVPT